ncbi:MAG: endolytic transglycosylase MltG, partial [Bacteroides sp.]|nr:endolytic transglycosylase MltG [Bacteroides sp.]
MKKETRKLLFISTVLALLFGIAGAAHIYYYFFAKPFQITETAYIYIDRDDNVDSVYTKIVEAGNPKQMHGFESLVRYKGYTPKTGRYAIKPTDNMRYLHNRLNMGYQTPVRLTIGSVRTLDRMARNVTRQLM